MSEISNVSSTFSMGATPAPAGPIPVPAGANPATVNIIEEMNTGFAKYSSGYITPQSMALVLRDVDTSMNNTLTPSDFFAVMNVLNNASPPGCCPDYVPFPQDDKLNFLAQVALAPADAYPPLSQAARNMIANFFQTLPQTTLNNLSLNDIEIANPTSFFPLMRESLQGNPPTTLTDLYLMIDMLRPYSDINNANQANLCLSQSFSDMISDRSPSDVVNAVNNTLDNRFFPLEDAIVIFQTMDHASFPSTALAGLTSPLHSIYGIAKALDNLSPATPVQYTIPSYDLVKPIAECSTALAEIGNDFLSTAMQTPGLTWSQACLFADNLVPAAPAWNYQKCFSVFISMNTPPGLNLATVVENYFKYLNIAPTDITSLSDCLTLLTSRYNPATQQDFYQYYLGHQSSEAPSSLAGLSSLFSQIFSGFKIPSPTQADLFVEQVYQYLRTEKNVFLTYLLKEFFGANDSKDQIMQIVAAAKSNPNYHYDAKIDDPLLEAIEKAVWPS